MEQRLVKINELQVRDEIIISCHSQLRYLKIVQIPKNPDSTRFKCSFREQQRTSGGWSYTINSFEQDVEQHNKVKYQDLYGRDIFLVKREEI